MIKTLEIKNFKSIKHLQLDCKRVNLLIGKPNTGKSNILESVGIFSLAYSHGNLHEIVRFENMTNLFHDHELNKKLEVTADAVSLAIEFENGRFKVSGNDQEKKVEFNFDLDFDGKTVATGFPNSPFKFYKFEAMNTFNFTAQESGSLLPVRGENLLQILLTNKDMRKVAANLFSEYGFRLVLKPQDHKIELQKEVEDVIISYPYSLISDTLQRIVFYLTAIETNKNSILIFEEPEAHAFPDYTKVLAERIALDETNQYFVSTHNPYFLLSVLEKTPKDAIGLFITYFEKYQTKVRPLAETELPEIFDLDASVFFNLDQFLEGT